MIRIDYINGHDAFDGSLWFVDGEYVGHDDQYDVKLAVGRGDRKVIDFHHRKLLDGLTPDEIDDIIMMRDLGRLERYLEPTPDA